MTFPQINSQNPTVTSSRTSTSLDNLSHELRPIQKSAAQLAGTHSDQIIRLYTEKQIIDEEGELIEDSSAPPISNPVYKEPPSFLSEELQLIPTDTALAPAIKTPREITATVCREIEKVVAIKDVYLYGGMLRTLFTAERLQKLASATCVSVPSEWIVEPKERAPDADIGIKVVVPDQKTYHALRQAIIRAVAKLYSGEGSEYAHETNVRNMGFRNFADTGFGENEPNQFFLIRLGDGKLKNIEIKISWKLERSNLFSITGWQSSWDYTNNVLGPIYHSDKELADPIIATVARQLRAKEPKKLNYKAWTRLQSLQCSNYTSNQIELEPILWTTLNAELGQNRACNLLNELVLCLEAHYPNDFNFAVHFLLHCSSTLLRQGDTFLAEAIWTKATWEELAIANPRCRYVSELCDKFSSSELSPLWKGIADVLFNKPSELPVIADLFSMAAFFKLNTVLDANDCMEHVELACHRKQLFFHLTFRSNHHCTLLLPMDVPAFGERALPVLANAGNFQQVVDALFLLPASAVADTRLLELGIDLQRLKAAIPTAATIPLIALRLKLEDLTQPALEPAYLAEVAATLEMPGRANLRIKQLGSKLREWAFPMTEKGLQNKADSVATRLAFFCDLAATKNPVAVNFACGSFREMNLPAQLVKGFLILNRAIAESSIDLALEQFQQTLDAGLFVEKMDLAIEAFINLQRAFKPSGHEIATAQTLTRFNRLSLKLRSSTTKQQEFAASCQALLLVASHNNQFAVIQGESAWKWALKLDAAVLNNCPMLLLSFLETALGDISYNEELGPIWKQIEAACLPEFKDQTLPAAWIDLCLILLEKTCFMKWHYVPQSKIWEWLKRSALTPSQTVLFNECARKYAEQLMQLNAWLLAIDHHAKYPRADIGYVNTWLDLLAKIQRNGQGSIWTYTSHVCSAADLAGLGTKERVLAFYGERLPTEVGQAKGDLVAKEQLAFVKWCARTLLAGIEPASVRLNTGISIFNKVRGWKIEGLRQNLFAKLLMPLACKITAEEKCLPEALSTLCTLAAEYKGSIDDSVRLALLSLVYRQESVENSWNYTQKALTVWSSPLTAAAAETIFRQCKLRWNGAFLSVAPKREQLKKVEAYCDASSYVGPAGELRNELLLTLVDEAIAQDNHILAWELLEEYTTRTENNSITPRHHKCLSLRISKKDIAGALTYLSAVQNDRWAEWENEWLQLAETECKPTVTKTILAKILPHIAAIKGSQLVKRWSESIFSMVGVLTQSDVAATAQFLKDFGEVLPPLSYRIMRGLVNGFTACNQAETAERYLVDWALDPNLTNERRQIVRRVWLEYLNTATTTNAPVLIGWLETNQTLFNKLEPSLEDRYQLQFRLTSQLVGTSEEPTGNLSNNIGKIVGVPDATPTKPPSLVSLWLKGSLEVLRKAAQIHTYNRLYEVYFYLIRYFREFQSTDQQILIHSVFQTWLENLVRCVEKHGATVSTDDLVEKAIELFFSRINVYTRNLSDVELQELGTANTNRTFIQLLARLGRSSPTFHARHASFRMFFDEAVRTTQHSEVIVEFITRWLQSADTKDNRFAMETLERSFTGQAYPSTLVAPVVASAKVLLKSNSQVAVRAGFLLGTYSSWVVYFKSKTIESDIEFLTNTNRAGIQVVRSYGMAHPIFVTANGFRTTAIKKMRSEGKLSTGLFVKTQRDLIVEILDEAEKNKECRKQLVLFACLQTTMLFRTITRMDKATFEIVRMISETVAKHDLLIIDNESEALFSGVYSELMGLAAEMGLFQGSAEIYNNFFKALYKRAPAIPLADDLTNPQAVHVEEFAALCQLTVQLESSELAELLFTQLVENITSDHRLQTIKRKEYIASQWAYLHAFVLHCFLGEPDVVRKKLAYTNALSILMESLILDFWKDNPQEFNEIFKELFNIESKYIPDTSSNTCDIILLIANRIIATHPEIPKTDSVIPRVVTLLKDSCSRLMTYKPNEFLQVFDYLTTVTCIERGFINEDDLRTIFESTLSKTGTKRIFAHGVVIQASSDLYMQAIAPLDGATLWSQLIEHILRFAINNGNHAIVISRSIELFNAAVKTHKKIEISADELFKFYSKLAEAPLIYKNTDHKVGISNITTLIRVVEGAYDNSKPLTLSALSNLFSLVASGFLERDAEFFAASITNTETAKTALRDVFSETIKNIQGIITRMCVSKFAILVPLWYEKIIDKAIQYNKIVACPPLKEVLVKALDTLQLTVDANTSCESSRAALTANVDAMKAKVEAAFPFPVEHPAMHFFGTTRIQLSSFMNIFSTIGFEGATNSDK